MGPKDAVLYFALSLRNVGNGIALLHGWRLHTDRPQAGDQAPPLADFRMQTRAVWMLTVTRHWNIDRPDPR